MSSSSIPGCRRSALIARFIERLRAVAPDVRIVVLNWSDSAESQAGLPGADAYIRKTFRPHELIDAVVSAASKSVA